MVPRVFGQHVWPHSFPELGATNNYMTIGPVLRGKPSLVLLGVIRHVPAQRARGANVDDTLPEAAFAEEL